MAFIKNGDGKDKIINIITSTEALTEEQKKIAKKQEKDKVEEKKELS